MNRTLEERIIRLEKLLNRVNRINSKFSRRKFEGGASGHMSHIYDYTELSLRDVKGIIRNLFSGKIEDVTEKLDGMNMQCTVNNDGQVVFIRNKKDLNSISGGMSLDDVIAKWAGKDHIAGIYTAACNTIIKVFNKIGKKFFNPNKNTKILANCECIGEGKTNIVTYASAQVDFHNLWVYTRKDENSEWEKSEVTTDGISVLEKACEGIDGAQLTPKVIIRVTEKSESMLVDYIKKIDAIFKEAGCSERSTIEDYKKARFYSLCENKHQWIADNKQGMEILFNRWFNDDKSVNLKEIKKIYKDNLDDLNSTNYKQIIGECMRPLDTFFGSLGNSIIALCDGMVNAGAESAAIEDLRNDLAETVALVREQGSTELNDKLTVQLNRLAALGNQLNSTEGIVFKYKDKLMKATGSFASVNQILGMRYNM